MSHLFVCSLNRLEETVTRTGARRLVTLINATTLVTRPPGIAPDDHLLLAMNDIDIPIPGMAAPAEHHLRSLIGFVREWDRAAPMVIHCWAGISRSTAAAYIAAATLNPERDEKELAETLRAQAPSATPNRRLIKIADRLLARNGRMVAAIEGIGRGIDAYEGQPFELPLLAGAANGQNGGSSPPA